MKMKNFMLTALLLAVCLAVHASARVPSRMVRRGATALAAQPCVRPIHGMGEDYTAPDGSFATHASAKQFPQEGEMLYDVAVDGKYAGLYTDSSHWGGLVHFGSFEFADGREITVDINYAHEIKSFEILPKTLNIKAVKQTSPRSLRFKLRKADQNITLIVNGEPKRNVLHLFAASIDRDAPEVPAGTGFRRFDERKLIYFGPGYYDLEKLTGKDELAVPDGWQVYVAAGAVVYGRISAWKVGEGTSLRGRGMIYNDARNPRMIFTVTESTGMRVEGLVFHTHLPRCWQVGVTRSRDIVFENVKILSTRYASTDGLDIVNSSDCRFANMFIRANDDAVAVKGLQNGKPEDCLPNRNLVFEQLQLWNDCNNAFGLGAETRASVYENIQLRNSCVLFSYDDPDNHEKLDERAALTICCLEGTFFRNILYENIDVYHCERLVAEGFKPDFWFGSIQGNQTTAGGIDGVTFRNVRSFASSGSSIANQIHLYGWRQDGTPDKYVENVTFENLRIEGRKVKSAVDSHFLVDSIVKGLVVR